MMTEPAQYFPVLSEPLLIVISGLSGAGKDSIINRMKERNQPFHFVVTVTTRPPRDNEVEGADYFFITQEQFTHMVERGELLEYAWLYDHYSGVPKEQVKQALASGKDVVLRLDVQGDATIQSLFPEALLIFLTVEDEAELRHRLSTRRTEPLDKLEARIAKARQELECIESFDYIVLNPRDRLDEAVNTITSIIKAEHQRVHSRKVQP